MFLSSLCNMDIILYDPKIVQVPCPFVTQLIFTSLISSFFLNSFNIDLICLLFGIRVIMVLIPF